MRVRLRSLRSGLLSAAATATLLIACGSDDSTDNRGFGGNTGGGQSQDGASDGKGTGGSGGSGGSVAHDGSADGSDAGTGGSDAGTGGSDAGTGGSDAGTGGSDLDAAAEATPDAETSNDANDAGQTEADGAVPIEASADAADQTDSASATDAVSTDSATADAVVEAGSSCGDGVKTGAEDCDLGGSNSDALTSTCSSTCTRTSLVLWLDGKDPNGDGSSVADGAAMSKWVDKALGNDALQGTASYQPIYSAPGAGAVFDGADDFFAVPLDINAATIPELTVIAVLTNAPGNPQPYAGVWGQDNGGWDRFFVSGGQGSTGVSNGGGFTSASGLLAESTPLVTVTTLIAGGASSVYVNGNQGASFTEVAQDGTSTLTIGNLNGPPNPGTFGAFDGTISEIMVFNRALTAAERVTLGAQLAAKYGAAEFCGNGVIEGAEQCDNGVGNDGTGCDPDCMLSPEADVLLHCSAVNTVLHDFVGAGCHTVTEQGGASYLDLINDNTVATVYPTTDCSGSVFLDNITADINFCYDNFNDNSGLNDSVWSVKLERK